MVGEQNRDNVEWRTVDSGHEIFELFARFLIPKMVKMVENSDKEVDACHRRRTSGGRRSYLVEIEGSETQV
jgi:hypothetical protein